MAIRYLDEPAPQAIPTARKHRVRFLDEAQPQQVSSPQQYRQQTIQPAARPIMEQLSQDVRQKILSTEAPKGKEVLKLGAQVAPYAIPPLAGLKGVSMGAKIGRAILPALSSGAIVGGSEAGLGLLEGQKPTEALKRGGVAGATTAALTGGLQLVGGAAKGIGRYVVKKSLDPQFSEPIVRQTLEDISLTKPAKKTFEEINKKTIKGVSQLDRVFGKLVGRGKANAIKSGELVDIKPIRKEAINLIRESRLAGVKEGKKAVSKHMNVLKNVTKELDKSKMNMQDSLTSLQNMDNALLGTYTRQKAPGVSLSKAEQLALRIRGKLSGQIDKATAGALGKNKQKYVELRKILGENRNELAKKLTDKDAIYSTLKSSMKEGDVPMLRRLEQIDDMLPKNKKFLKDVTNKFISEEISKSARVRPGFRLEGLYDLITPIAAPGLRAAPKIGRASGIGARAAGVGIGRLSYPEEMQ